MKACPKCGWNELEEIELQLKKEVWAEFVKFLDRTDLFEKIQKPHDGDER